MDLADKILQILEETHKKSGGHCGTYGADLVNDLETPWNEIREELKRLYGEKKIAVKTGSKGNLFFINEKGT